MLAAFKREVVRCGVSLAPALGLLARAGRHSSSLPHCPQPNTAIENKRRWHRPAISCDVCFDKNVIRPSLDERDLFIERAMPCHAKMVRSFLYSNFWTLEPAITSLYMCLNSDYLSMLTEKYANTGDSYIAFERECRTGERRMVGVAVCTKMMPWTADEYEEWGRCTKSRPERHHMFFMAHCIRSADLCHSHHVPFLYDISAVATSKDVKQLGIGRLLIQKVLDQSRDIRVPSCQVIATSKYVQNICAKEPNMELVWSMAYKDFVDDAGQQVFCVRRPHTEVQVFGRKLTCAVGNVQPCLPNFGAECPKCFPNVPGPPEEPEIKPKRPC